MIHCPKELETRHFKVILAYILAQWLHNTKKKKVIFFVFVWQL